MSLKEEDDEFRDALRDIGQKVIKLQSHFDRVRCCEWVRKLASLPTNDFDSARIRSDYIQYLRIIVRTGFLHGIFMRNPPIGDLKPLAEALGAELISNLPKMPEVGPVAPYLSHRSPDGRAYVSIKRLPGEGILCYMAVSPEGL